MRHKLLISILVLFLAVIVVAAQDENCPELVQQALQTAEAQCSDTGRNQICYGHVALEVEAQPDAANFTFENIGDIADVADVQRLQLAGLNVEDGTWGVVMMRLQANIPNTLPGQNVTVLLFGDTEIRNVATSVAQQIPPEQERTVTADQNVNVRELPNAAARILGSVAPGTEITATGRNTDSSWLRVRLEEQTGWILASLLKSDSDIADLAEVNPEDPVFGPMQAFYFTSGVGQTKCDEVPGDGMLVQTPQGISSIDLTVNEVQVSMGSTVYFTVNEDQRLSISPVEGATRISSEGMTQTAVKGTRVWVQLDDDLAYESAPSEPESYAEDDSLAYLPVEALDRDIEIGSGLDDEELDRFLEYDTVFENLNIDDVDEAFDYVDENWDNEDFDLAGYLIDELDYTDFDDELESYMENDLGYDLSEYDDYEGDDSGDYGDYGSDYGDSSGDYGDDYGDDSGVDYGDDYGDDSSDYGEDSSGDYGSDYGDDSGGDYGGDDYGD